MIPASLLRAAVVSLLLSFSCCVLPAIGQERGGQERIVNVLGWGDYIDPRVLLDFTEATGIKVTYDGYNSDHSLETRLQSGVASFDVVIASGRVLQKQIAGGLYLKLDKAKIANMGNLWPEIMTRLAVYDPHNQYAVPYAWFSMGIAYDVRKAREFISAARPGTQRKPSAALSASSFDSWDLLFKPENLSTFANCGVGILNSPEELFVIAKQYLWYDWRRAPPLDRRTDIERAANLLTAIGRSTKLLESDGYADALARGEICMAVGSSLDGLRARYAGAAAEPFIEIEFFIPKEGAAILLDSLAIPKNAPHVEEAYALIDFLLRPDIAARNTNFIGVANGVLASKSMVDVSISGNKSIYPDAAMMQRLVAPQYATDARPTPATSAGEGTRTKMESAKVGSNGRFSKPAKLPLF